MDETTLSENRGLREHAPQIGRDNTFLILFWRTRHHDGAMIYVWWHEQHRLIPKHGRKIPLMKIFVDDIYAIVLVGDADGISEEEWENSNTTTMILRSSNEMSKILLWVLVFLILH